MATEAQLDLEVLITEIAQVKEHLKALETKYKDHPAHLEVIDQCRMERLIHFKIPVILELEWRTLSDIQFSHEYVGAWSSMGDSGGGYTSLIIKMSFSDGRSFKFHSSEQMLHMDDRSFEEFGWAPSHLDTKHLTVSKLWEASKKGHNKGKHICCAIASFIYYLYLQNKQQSLPWDLKKLLHDLSIQDI